ncbi:MAG: hypothetical protein WCO00_13945 [Rhodospirillaceae bacterium]
MNEDSEGTTDIIARLGRIIETASAEQLPDIISFMERLAEKRRAPDIDLTTDGGFEAAEAECVKIQTALRDDTGMTNEGTNARNDALLGRLTSLNVSIISSAPATANQARVILRRLGDPELGVGETKDPPHVQALRRVLDFLSP